MKPLVIYVDYWCPLCLRFAKYIKRLDVFNKIKQENIRNCLDQKVDLVRGLNELACTNGRRTLYGFHSIFLISKRLPILWACVPIFWLFKISGLGDLIYRELAQKRTVIPFHCHTNCKKPTDS